MESNSSAGGPPHALAASAVSDFAPGGLVCVSLLKDRLPAGQPRILSLQRRRHAQSSAHPAGSRNEALATLRILRSLPAHSGGIAGYASSTAEAERERSSANSVLDAGSISFRGARLPGFPV